MHISYNSATEPKPKVNLSELNLLTSTISKLKAWYKGRSHVETICLVVQVQNQHLDLSQETDYVLAHIERSSPLRISHQG